MCNFGFQTEALNRAFLDIFEELLFLQNFFDAKLPPGTAKTVFANPKGPPLWMLKKKILHIKFLSKPCDGNWSQDSKIVECITLGYCKYFL